MLKLPNRTVVKVLLVDDDQQLLALIRKILASSKTCCFQTEAASTLGEALLQIEHGRFDAVTLDLSLPDSTGYETFRRVRNAAPDLPLVVLSGLDDEALAIRMVRDGAQDYVVKEGDNVRILPRTIEYAIERKAARQELDAERNLLRNVLNSLPEKIWVKDTGGRYVVDNAPHHKFLGADREGEVIGKTIFDFLSPERAAEIAAEDRGVTQSLRPVNHRLQSSGRQWHSVSKVPLFDARGRVIGLVGLAHDLTHQKKIEARLRDSQLQLRTLAARLETDREEFQTRIARELHDQFGQFLTALKMDLVALAKLTASTPEVLTEKAWSAANLVDSCIGLVREICSELRPSPLNDLGLTAALEWQATEFEKRCGIVCECSGPKNIDLDGARSTGLFRITQEALTNVLRHAGAKHVLIRLKQDDHEVELEIRDDGRGIKRREVLRRGSLGLLGMRERVEAFNGSFEISGSPDRGTTLRVRLPRGKNS